MGMSMSSWAFTMDLYENPEGSPLGEITHYQTPTSVGVGDIIIMEYGTTVADESNPLAWSDILRFGGSPTQGVQEFSGTTTDVWLISDPATLLANAIPAGFIWEDINGFAVFDAGNIYNIHSDGDSVPDAGSTSMLLGLALAGLGAARRFMRR